MQQTFVAAAFAGVCATASLLPVAAGAPEPAVTPATQSDLDAFMHQVLAKRDENWKKLQQFVLDEHEKVDVMGPALIPIMGQRREYRWYVRDGYFVRSPLTLDGVTVSEPERRKFEDEFLKAAKEQEKRAAEKALPNADPATPADSAGSQQGVTPGSMDALLSQSAQPQFIDTAYFLKFKFEEGKYALVGREKFDDREVFRIEYYPAHLFSDTADADKRRTDKVDPPKDKRQGLEIERLMNKNSLVTLWVEPKAKQIVKYAFDNVQTDFLPGSWLIRLEDFKASMTMSQPFKDVWLPRDVKLLLRATFAIGTLDLHYRVEYVDYKEANTGGRIIGRGGR
jgi:hypothetical protein